MPKNVRIITPVTTEGIRSLADVAPFERADLTFSHTLLDIGPSSIECEYDEALSVPDTIAKTIEAERDGADAVVIDCMGDPGLQPAREVASIPVLGPCETSMHIAAMLGHRFSFVTVLDSVRPMIENMAKVYGVFDRLASIRAIDIPVLRIEKDLGRVQDALAEQALSAVRQDNADVIILGCTGFLGCADAIKSELATNGYDVPVIDPVPTTALIAAALADLSLSQSKTTYAAPRDKPIVGFTVPSLTRKANAAE